MKYLLLGSSITTILAGVASAATTIVAITPQLHETTGIATFSTDGGHMTGLEVTVRFADLTSEVANWSGSGTSGSATGVKFKLEQAGQTFSQPWTLTNLSGSPILGFSLDGHPGDTVFDRTNPSHGTTGSDQGKDLQLGNDGMGSEILGTATYSDAVKLKTEALVGDLYLRVNVDLATPYEGTSFTFMQDTDTTQFINDLTAVPEPSTGLGVGDRKSVV